MTYSRTLTTIKTLEITQKTCFAVSRVTVMRLAWILKLSLYESTFSTHSGYW